MHRFCELACIINYRAKNVRVFVLSWEVTCMSLFLFVVVRLLDWEEHEDAFAEGDDVCRNVGRNYNRNLLRLLCRERITSGTYFVMYLWHSELALKVLKRVTFLLFGFSFFKKKRRVIIQKYNKYGPNRKKVYFIEEKVEATQPEPSQTAVRFTEL